MNYCESFGWKVDSHPIKDWNAAARIWEQWENILRVSPGKPVPAQRYVQWNYNRAQETPEKMMARLTTMNQPPVQSVSA